MRPRLWSAATLSVLLAVSVALLMGDPVAAHAQTRATPPKRIAPAGYTLAISPSLSALAGSRTRGMASCPKGKVPLSGGAFVQDEDTLVNMADSFPVGSSWVVDIANASSTATDFQVVVTCARKPLHYKVVKRQPATLAAGAHQTFVATCPTGSKPLAGGVMVASNSVLVSMAASLPQNRQWRVDANNASGMDASVTSFAVCASVPKYRILVGPASNVPAQSQVMVTVSCPAPTVVLGGGGLSGAASVAVNLAWSTMDEGFDWFTGVNNVSDASTGAASVVVCGT